MIRYIIISLFLTFSLFASSLEWSNNYHMARQKAKKENKNILLFISAKDNPYCEYMEEDTFKDKLVMKYIDKNYVAVRLVVNNKKNNIPRGIKFFSAPSIYFLTNKGKEIHKRIVGTITIKQMKEVLVDSIN